MEFFVVLRRINCQNAYLPKISIPIVFEILAQLSSDDSIQIPLHLTQFITLATESNLEGFVRSYQSETGLVSPRHFAPQC